MSSHADRLRVQQQRADADAAHAQHSMSEAAQLKSALDERERALSAAEADWRAAAAAWVAQRVRYAANRPGGRACDQAACTQRISNHFNTHSLSLSKKSHRENVK